MVRILAILVGAFFSLMMVYSAVRTSIGMVTEPATATAEEEFHLHPKHVKFSSDGPFGKFDRPQLQRGFQVYKEVCASCHGLKQVAFRDLADLGYSEGQIKTIASEWAIETPSLNPETGEAATRKPLASDKIPSSYPNEVAARAANNNALPPDLSLITKSRHGGAAYTYSLLTGYQDPNPELLKKFPEMKPSGTLHHNPYFANLNIAMPAPLVADGQVTYDAEAKDHHGKPIKPTVDQMAKDVSAFLIWTAEPKLENRHRAGIPTIIFLLFFAMLCWMSYQHIWTDKKKH
jgi:ubiquinol-cytochrome c reductase cytochrome c1 subunit